MAINGKAALVLGTGVLFTWSGIKGWSITGSIADMISGKKPAGTVINPLTAPGGSVKPGAGTAGSLVSFAETSIGHAYVFGGAPGPQGANGWDCSSMVNYGVAFILQRAIPGYGAGKWDGNTHGPTTFQWATWNGVNTISRAQVQAGDLVIWATHMGIAVSNDRMVSALNEKEGTRETGIEGTAPGPIVRLARL